MKKLFFAVVVLFSISTLISFKPSEKETLVLISTSMGDIKLKLYNETPIHRDNFIKLVKEKKYDGSIFHRVINNFMIQGGGINGGTADIGEQIKAEINPMFIHKRGALCAARMGDNVNPEKKSSGSQFYIVQNPRKYTAAELDQMSRQTKAVYTEEQKKIYAELGGTPHLDANYTVFGEVVSGLDVVDKIATTKTAKGDRPLEDIKMTIKIVKK